ncbi:hypothetical protein U0070_020852 [Myodes glareolus]|uniref:Uncharacterized protein n=1 Tax=Myodes glareolus TaxID=447135 RepID=A0AAW0IPH8_MYOGA
MKGGKAPAISADNCYWLSSWLPEESLQRTSLDSLVNKLSCTDNQTLQGLIGKANCWKACWDMSSVLDAWCATETWQQGGSERMQDVTRNQVPESRLPGILNALSCLVTSCPTDKLATHLATTEGNLRKYHWQPRPRRLPHLEGKSLTVI